MLNPEQKEHDARVRLEAKGQPLTDADKKRIDEVAHAIAFQYGKVLERLSRE